MAKKKLTRKQLLKQPDEFLSLSAKVTAYVTGHQRQFEYLGIALGILILMGLGGYTYYRHINKTGQEYYNEGYNAFMQAFNPDMKAKDLKKPEELFQRVIDDYGLSNAAILALPEEAYLRFLNKDYDDAITLYRKFLDKVSGNYRYESLARLALAACYEQKGDLQTAIVTLKPILTELSNPFREPAMLNIARLYRLTHQVKMEKEVLKEFVATYKNSPFLPIAKAHL